MGSTGSLLALPTGHSAKDNPTHWVLGPLCFSCLSKVCCGLMHTPFLGSFTQGTHCSHWVSGNQMQGLSSCDKGWVELFSGLGVWSGLIAETCICSWPSELRLPSCQHFHLALPVCERRGVLGKDFCQPSPVGRLAAEENTSVSCITAGAQQLAECSPGHSC